MRKHYSLSFKKEVLKQYMILKDITSVSLLFKISKRTLFYWLSKEKENNLNVKFNHNKIGKPYKINIEILNQLNQDNKEDYTLKELGNILKVSSEAIRKYFIKNKITFKKKNYDTEKATKLK